MIQKIKSKYLLGCIMWAIVLTIVCGVLLIIQREWLSEMVGKGVELDNVRTAELKENMIIKLDVCDVIDCYAEATKNNRAYESYYFIPVGENEYMSLVCRGKAREACEKNLDVMSRYYEEEISYEEAAALLTSMKVQGTVRPIKGEAARYLREYISSFSQEEREQFLDYGVYVGGYEVGTIVIELLIALACLIGAVVLIFRGVTAANLKGVMRYCNAQGNADQALAQINDFLEREQEVNGFRCNDKFFAAVNGGKIFFAPSDQCLWCYQHVTQHKTNGIPTGKTYAIMMMKVDGTGDTIPVSGKRRCEEAIEFIARKMPYLLVGYTDDLSYDYKNHRSAIIEAVRVRREQYAGQSAAASEDKGPTLY